MKKRMNFTISDEAYDALIKVSKETGLSLSEVVRNAIRMYQWAKEESSHGNSIVSKSSKDDSTIEKHLIF